MRCNLQTIGQKILKIAQEQAEKQQKQDPTVVKQLLVQNLQNSIPREIILNQIFPDVNQRGLAKTVAGNNGVIVFQFKNNTQKFWNPQSKQYGDNMNQKAKTRSLVKSAEESVPSHGRALDRSDEAWNQQLKEENKDDYAEKQEQAKRDPNAIMMKLMQYLSKNIPADVIYTKILPSVTNKGLKSTKDVGGGKIVFLFNDGTQGIWSPTNKRYTEALAKKDYKNTILRKAQQIKKTRR